MENNLEIFNHAHSINQKDKIEPVSKDLLLFALTHDILAPLNSIQYLTKQLQGSLSNNLKDKSHYQDTLEIIDATIHTIASYAKDFIYWYNIPKEGQPTYSEFSTSNVISKIINNLKPLINANQNQITFQSSSEADASIYSEYVVFQMIIRNLIDNANKNSFNRTILISEHTTNDFYIFTIENELETKESYLIHYFEIQKILNQNKIEKKPDQGMGLIIIKQALKHIQGFITLTPDKTYKTIKLKIIIPKA